MAQSARGAYTAAATPTLHLRVALALSPAARTGELLNLLWLDVDTRAGRLIFRSTKNGEPRGAWLLEESLRLLKERAKSNPDPESRVFASPSGAAYDYLTPFNTSDRLSKRRPLPGTS